MKLEKRTAFGRMEKEGKRAPRQIDAEMFLCYSYVNRKGFSYEREELWLIRC